MAIVTVQGRHKLDARTFAQHTEAERLLGHRLEIVQGSYTGTVAASGSTHDQGGAEDCRTVPLKTRERKIAAVKALRRVGLWAWIRPYIPGVWGEHIHAISIQPGGRDDQGVLSRGAFSQVQAAYAGRDGLSGNRPDPHADLGIKPHTWEQYKASKIKVKVSWARLGLNKPRHADVLRVQRALASYVGLDYASAPGKWGPRTQAAWLRAIRKSGKRGRALVDFLGKTRGFVSAP